MCLSLGGGQVTVSRLIVSVFGLLSESKQRVTWRSVIIGVFGVCLICGVCPFNDYIVENTPAVGSYLPLVMMLFGMSDCSG